jgi:hypothetical protein
MNHSHRATPENRAPRPNGHIAANGEARTNGHAEAEDSARVAPSTSAPPLPLSAPRLRARAAADDPHAAPNATAAAPPPAGTARDDSAATARVSNATPDAGEPDGETSGEPAGGSASERPAPGTRTGKSGRGKPGDAPPANEKEHLELPPGELPLPPDGTTFVDAVHAKADLVEAGRRLLNSRDEKIVKGLWDLLVNLKYGNSEGSSEEAPPEVKVGIPRPIRPQPGHTPAKTPAQT